MILNFSFQLIAGCRKICCQFSLYKSYRAVSSVPVDILWEKLINLTDFSWHPLISSSNVPDGLIPKPGLIYQVVTRLIPIRLRIFVERVCPRELLSVRVLTIFGVEKRVTYQIESTLCGSYISYSISLRGCLSPLVWLVIKPYAARVASELARAAEQLPLGLLPPRGLETSE